jgi:glycosyltransferase involved in cell wall biosynthesis
MVLSIITITYNNFSELKKTLDSIPNYDFLESVVINGGDCQQTKEFLKSYRGKSISEEDRGISDAFNKGIRLSTGDLIMFLNSGDMLIEPSYLKSASDFLLENKNIDFVHSNLILADAHELDLHMRPTFSNLGRGMPYLHPTMITKKTVFDKVGLFNSKYKIAMDFDLIVRMKKANLNGHYEKSGFPVRMEGTGKSIANETAALWECFSILKENNALSIKNIFGYTQRYLLFFGRKFLALTGQSNFLVTLKRHKHHA